jgi:DNA polymerase III subunit chi
MTRIDFYFNADAKPEVARRLAAKAFQAGRQALVYTPDARLARQLDGLFWTAQPLAFLPHVCCGHALARRTPILIGDQPDELGSADILINLDARTPDFFARFERVLEVVGADEADRLQARERFRHYRERGYALTTHDLAAVA